MRLLKIILVLLVIWLGYSLGFGKNSISEYFAFKAQVEALEQTNQNLLRRNSALQAEIVDLRSGVAAIEEHARNDLGYIKQGEVFYRIIPSSEQ